MLIRKNKILIIIIIILITIITVVVVFNYLNKDNQIYNQDSNSKQEEVINTGLIDDIKLKAIIENSTTTSDDDITQDIVKSIANLLYNTQQLDKITAVIQPETIKVSQDEYQVVVFVKENQVYYLATYYLEYKATYLECANNYPNNNCDPTVVGYDQSDQYREVEFQ